MGIERLEEGAADQRQILLRRVKDRDVVGDERAKRTNRKASRLELPRRGWIDDRDADAVSD